MWVCAGNERCQPKQWWNGRRTGGCLEEKRHKKQVAIQEKSDGWHAKFISDARDPWNLGSAAKQLRVVAEHIWKLPHQSPEMCFSMIQHASATIQGISCLAKQRVHWCFQGASLDKPANLKEPTLMRSGCRGECVHQIWRFSFFITFDHFWSNHFISMTENNSPFAVHALYRQWTVGTFGRPLGVIWPMRTCLCLGLSLSSLICGVYSLWSAVLVFCGLWPRVIFPLIMTHYIMLYIQIKNMYIYIYNMISIKLDIYTLQYLYNMISVKYEIISYLYDIL